MFEETLWKEIQAICEGFFSKIKDADKKLGKAQWIADYARVRALLLQLKHDYPDIDVTKTQDETYNAASRYFQDILFVAIVKNEEFRVNREFSEHMVELAEDDTHKLQGLIDEARKLITTAKWLNDDHRRRILLGLERLQTEIHKTKSDYDVALARMADAGAAVGKFGKDA